MTAVELYWLPLGAGGRSVRLNGKLFEAVAALLGRRKRRELFHSALIVKVDDEQYAIELCPEAPGDHGRVAGGAVGSRVVGGLRIFRYEARCWQGGSIPDIRWAVESPVTVSADPLVAHAVLGHVRTIPTPVWGRDELGAGEMWNSNSVIAWLLERSGVDTTEIAMPTNGRAPGWRAGVVVARRAAA